MTPAGRTPIPCVVPLRRRIAGRPVAAFVVFSIALSWVALILPIALFGNALPGILAELLILLRKLGAPAAETDHGAAVAR